MEELSNHMAGLSINTSQGWTDSFRRIANTLRTRARATTTHPWTTSLGSLTSNTTGYLFPVAAALIQNRGHTGSLFYIVLIAMVLQNWHALYHFRAASDYAFEDNRPQDQRGCDTTLDYVSLSGWSARDLYGNSNLLRTECNKILAGAYLHVLNLHPPVPFFGQLFEFSEEAYWQSADETSGALQSFFVGWLGNPANNQRTRLNYASVHVGISLLFVSILCQTVSNRPFGSRGLGRGTSWTAGLLFALLLLQRIIINFPFWAFNAVTGA